jgi:Fe-Mn family superoxide dismutase
MNHEARNFEHLLGKLKGIRDEQLEAHFGLYRRYVEKLNEIETALADAGRGGGDYSYDAYSELKRRDAVAFN